MIIAMLRPVWVLPVLDAFVHGQKNLEPMAFLQREQFSVRLAS
jgi:hypothetical protein